MGRKLFLWGIIIWSKWKIHFCCHTLTVLHNIRTKTIINCSKSNVEFVFLFHFVNDLWHAKLNAVVDNNDWCWMVTLSNERIHIIALDQYTEDIGELFSRKLYWLYDFWTIYFAKAIYLSTQIITYIFGNVQNETKAHSISVASMWDAIIWNDEELRLLNACFTVRWCKTNLQSPYFIFPSN